MQRVNVLLQRPCGVDHLGFWYEFIARYKKKMVTMQDHEWLLFGLDLALATGLWMTPYSP
jgi:hypothetical protein